MRSALLRFRPVISLLAITLLVGTAHRIENPTDHLVLLAVIQFLICTSTMFWNDVLDYTDDQSKTSRLTVSQYRLFMITGTVGWVLISIVLMTCWNRGILSAWQTGVFGVQFFIGVWGYHMVRPLPVINNLVVGLTAGSTVLLLLPGQNYADQLFIYGVLATVTMVITAREALKGITDVDSDKIGGRTLYRP